MKYQRYYPIDVVNGEGIRSTLFVSGCEHFCKGCYNSTTWDPDTGIPYTDSFEQKIIDDLGDTRINRDGLSLSGGDPLFPRNLDMIERLVKRVKTECPEKDIWLWTGYRLENLSPIQKEVVRHVDVLIDGKFEEDKKNLSLPWRGSSNQRVMRLINGKPESYIF